MSEELVYGLRSLMDAVDDNPGRNIEVASSLCKDLGEMVYKQQARIEALKAENDALREKLEENKRVGEAILIAMMLETGLSQEKCEQLAGKAFAATLLEADK